MPTPSLPLTALLLFFIGTGAAGAPVETVSFETTDGRRLVADYGAAAAGRPTVVLLHGLGSTREEWRPLVSRLADSGAGVLAYDARGHGASAVAPDEVRSFGPPRPGSPWMKMIDDVGAAMRYLERAGVRRDAIVLGGASLGANVALNYVALTRPVSRLLLLSPGSDYQGITLHRPLEKNRRTPVLIVVSEADAYAYESVARLALGDPQMEIWTDVSPGHGVQMFDEKLLGRLVDWILR